MKSYEQLINEYAVNVRDDPDKTNEDIAIEIQNGRRDLIPVLWNRVLRFVILRCRAYYDTWETFAGGAQCELEDLIQTAYLQIEPAARYYDGPKGFLGILSDYYLRNAFRKLRGIQTSKRDALKYAGSLDAPVGGSEDDTEATLLDLIRDPSAEFEEDVAEEIYQQELRKRLDTAMNEELRPEEEKILRLYYYEGKTDPEIAGLAGCTGSTIQTKRKEALMKLYRAQRRYRLEEFIEDHTNYYMAAGVGAFQNSGGSVVENLVIRREDLKYKFLKGET